MGDGETRKYAAILGKRYFDRTVTAGALFEHFGHSADPLIQELLIAVAHEPRRGFWGVSENWWHHTFWVPVSQVLAELEKGEEGRIPDKVVARLTGWKAFGLLFAIVWVGASAADRLIQVLNGAASPWNVLPAAVFAFLTISLIIVFRNRLRLLRFRKSIRDAWENAG